VPKSGGTTHRAAMDVIGTDGLAKALEPFERRVFVVVGGPSGTTFGSRGRATDALSAAFDSLNARLGRSNWCALVLMDGEVSGKEDDSAPWVMARAHCTHGVSCVFLGGSGSARGGAAALRSAIATVPPPSRGGAPTGPLGSHPSEAERKPLLALCCAPRGSHEDDRGRSVAPGPCLVGRRGVLAQLAGVIAVGEGSAAAGALGSLCDAAGLPARCIRPCLGAAGAVSDWLASRPAGAGRGEVARGRVALTATPALGNSTGGALTRAAGPGGIRARVEDGWAMTMHQPWAGLVISGHKRAEGRVWGLDFTGWLWIHAGGKPPMEADLRAIEAMYRDVYATGAPPERRPAGAGEDDGAGEAAVLVAATPRSVAFPAYPTGCLLGCVFVSGMASLDEYRRLEGSVPPSVTAESESPFVFLCERPRRLAAPIPMKGQHKLWRLSPRSSASDYAAALLPAATPQPVTLPLERRAV